MSVWIYGYINSETSKIAQKVRKKIMDYKKIGIREESSQNLWNWPDELLPKSVNNVCFSIHDQPGKTGSEYILDYVEYSPQAVSSLPLDKDIRLNMFLHVINYLMTIEGVCKLLVAVTDSCEITCIRSVTIDDFSSTLRADLELAAPPNTLYVINRQLSSA